jgi:hypothetical protein
MSECVNMCGCVCVCVCVRARARARACVRVYECESFTLRIQSLIMRDVKKFVSPFLSTEILR